MHWLNAGPKTHTFHFSHGETTITLEDVTLQLGLKIDGLPVRLAYQTLLGDIPPDKYIKGK